MDNENINIFFNFYKKMVIEYDKHTPIKAHSWKSVNLYDFLSGFVNDILQDNTPQSIIDNPDHLIDIAIYCVMIYHRLTHDKKTSELNDFFNYLEKHMTKYNFGTIEKLYQEWKYSLQ